MRLSLKTILAYTDNLFDAEYLPAVKKRIGKEEAAGRLMERIHAVSSNPDLSVPGRSDQKAELSANFVAAYLDHQLSEAEQVQFEVVCLRSDVFLAEVACAHQILTTRLGQPASLNRECRLRLYALSRRNHQPPVADETNGADDAIREPVEQPDDAPAQAVASDAPDEFRDGETVSQSGKKRRITVVSQGNVVAAPPPDEESSMTARISGQQPREDPPNIQFVADAVRKGEVPAERLAFYPANHSPQNDEPIACVSHAETTSRLGQAFERLNRRRRIMFVSSLALLFLCVSVVLLSNRKPSLTENDTARQQPSATTKDIVQVEGEEGNDRRFAENHVVWAKPNEPSTAVVADFSTYAAPTYAAHESPDLVMRYLPVEANRQTHPQVTNRTAFAADFPVSPVPVHPSPPMDMQQAALSATDHRTMRDPGMQAPAQTPVIYPASGSHAINPAQGVYPVTMALDASGRTALSAETAFAQNRSRPQADMMSQGMSGNVLAGGGNPASPWETSTQQVRASIQPQDSGLMLQLIDRGSAQSVTQFIHHDLPAVRTATAETGFGSEPPPVASESKTNGRNEPSRQTGSRTRISLSPDDQASLPPYRMIEQVSYVASRDTQEQAASPPFEPDWNRTDHGGFEAISDTTTSNSGNAEIDNINDHLPDAVIPRHDTMTASQPASPRRPNERHSMVAETARSENRSIVNVPQTASETVAFDETSSPVRMPEHIARNSNRLNSLPSIRQSQSDETFEQEEPGADSPVMVLGKEDIALVREVPGTEWAWLPVSKRLNADAVVLVPAPFSAVFRFVNGVIVETTGDTRIQILPPDESGRPVIAFDYGHLTVSTGWKRNPDEVQSGDISRSLRIVTPVGSGVLRLTDSRSFVSVDSENRTSVKLLKVTRPYESVTRNPLFYTANLENNVTYCPNLTAFPAEKQSIFWRKDGNEAEWELAAVSVFPIDIEKNVGPIIVFDTNDLIVTPPIVWPSLVSHDGNIPISKLDLKNQFVTMPYTFYPTPSKTWLLK